jgi:hypothetical protein
MILPTLTFGPLLLGAATWYVIAQVDGAGSVTGLLTGSGVTVVGLLLAGYAALGKGWWHPNPAVRQMIAQYEAYVADLLKQNAQLRKDLETWQQRAWEGARIGEAGATAARQMAEATKTTVAALAPPNTKGSEP